MNLNFNLTGAERKKLVAAAAEILGTEATYLKAPTYAYQIGDYTVDRDGNLTGPELLELLTALAERGFQPEAQADVATDAAPKADKRTLPRLYTLDTPRGEIFISEEFATHDEAAAEGYGEYFSTALGTVYSYGDDHTFALVTSRKAGDWDTTKIGRDFRNTVPAAPPADNPVVAAMLEPLPEMPPAETPADDLVVIEVPLDGFDLAKLENLRRLVDSKAALIKKALRADDLPIHIEDDKVVFPWFKGVLDDDTLNAYAQFVAALCETAKKKTRVVAKDSGDYENPRFSMRLFTVAIGLIGQEYRLIRKLLTKPMDGNGAWRYGDPKKRTAAAEPTDIAAEEVPGDA